MYAYEIIELNVMQCMYLADSESATFCFSVVGSLYRLKCRVSCENDVDPS